MRPQRGSRATSTTGASARIAPRARISRAATREHARDEFRVPGAGKGDRLREAGSIARDIAVQRLLVHQDRDAEPRVLDRPMLRGVDIVRGLAGIAVDGSAMAPAAPFERGNTALVGRTGHPADPVREGLRRRLPERSGRRRSGPSDLCSQMVIIWATFSSSVMRAEQVVDAPVNRLPGILVDRAASATRR